MRPDPPTWGLQKQCKKSGEEKISCLLRIERKMIRGKRGWRSLVKPGGNDGDESDLKGHLQCKKIRTKR